MTITMLTALLLQALTIFLIRLRLGNHWLRRPASLVVLASAVYQGLSPILLMLPSVRAWNDYRIGVQQNFVDSGMLLVSAGMFAFAIAYLMVRPERVVPDTDPTIVRVAAKALNWRWLACACLPLAVLTYQGRGYNNAVAGDITKSLSTNLASTFFIALVVLTAFSFLLRYGVRWFIPMLMAQSLLLAAAGERTPVITDAITLIALLSHIGRRPSGRQLRVALAITILAILAITGVRAEQGRSLYYENSGLTARVLALPSGLVTLTNTSGTSATGPNLIAQAATRLDGVDFAGAIMQSASFGHPRLSAAYVPESLLLVVPSAAWSSKLSHGTSLNPTLLELRNYGMQQINFLPTLAGLYIGFLSPLWLIAFLAFVGLLCGWGERLLFVRCTPTRLVLLAGSVNAALSYEQGLPGMLLALRAAAAIAIIVKLIEILGVRNAQRRSGMPSPNATSPNWKGIRLISNYDR